jgi:hypothetical protein
MSGGGAGGDGGRSVNATSARATSGGRTPKVMQASDVWNRMGVEASVRYTAKVCPSTQYTRTHSPHPLPLLNPKL